MIGHGTKLQSAYLIDVLSAAETWRVVRHCSISFHAESLVVLKSDPGSNLASKEFRNKSDELGLVITEMPTEAHE